MDKNNSQNLVTIFENTVKKAPPTFMKKTWKDDFALIVERKKLYVSKAILAYASPVFDKIFQSDFKKKNQEEMELPEKNFHDVLEFLHCICPGKEINICAENVNRILPLAEEYQVVHLKYKCEVFLIGKLKDESKAAEVYDMLQLALTYNMDDLHKKCVTEASKRTIEELEKALQKSDFPLKTRCMIQDKMIRRLEKYEQKARSLQALNRYLILGPNNVEKFKIMNCEKWEDASLDFALNGTELQKRNGMQTKEFKILDIDAKFICKNSQYGSASIELSFDANDLKGCVVTVFGRFVIQNRTQKNPDKLENIEMVFRNGQCKNTKNMKIEKLFDLDEGFIDYCNSEIKSEIYILAGKQMVQ